MPQFELIMTDAPTTKVKAVKERKRRGRAEKGKRAARVQSRGARAMNPRRR